MSAANGELARSRDGTAISYETIGVGEGLLVLGGAWRTSRDYLPFAHALADSFAVHVIDRRGRGRSGPQGPAYTIERELDDVAAVQAQTHARLMFGHSYGGLIALEAARRKTDITDIVAYEPGVSIAGSVPLGWMPRYRELLGRSDRRGAFAAMVRSAGGAPAALERAPLWYVKLILRLFIRNDAWQQIEPLSGNRPRRTRAGRPPRQTDRRPVSGHRCPRRPARRRQEPATFDDHPVRPPLGKHPGRHHRAHRGTRPHRPRQGRPAIVAERVRYHLQNHVSSRALG